MKRFAVTVVILCLVLTPVFSFAGQKTIRLESNPEGATIYMDGSKVGVTPMTLNVDGRWWYESNVKHEFKAEKAGYAPAFQTISATQANIPAIIAGFCCLFPFLWAAEIPDVVRFSLYPAAQ